MTAAVRPPDPVIFCTQFQLAFYFWQRARNPDASAVDIDLDLDAPTPNTAAFRAWWQVTTQVGFFDSTLHDLMFAAWSEGSTDRALFETWWKSIVLDGQPIIGVSS